MMHSLEIRMNPSMVATVLGVMTPSTRMPALMSMYDMSHLVQRTAVLAGRGIA